MAVTHLLAPEAVRAVIAIREIALTPLRRPAMEAAAITGHPLQAMAAAAAAAVAAVTILCIQPTVADSDCTSHGDTLPPFWILHS
jgi:hypothetical protein